MERAPADRVGMFDTGGFVMTLQVCAAWTRSEERQLIDTINNDITNWNQDSKPFTWTITPSDIMAKDPTRPLRRKKLLLTSNTDSATRH